jgi:predicted phage terminase large subunit-like protein
VIDDPTKPQGITDLSLQEVQRWKKETTASRLLPGGAFVLIMQRLHERDLAGFAEEEGGYDFLRLPMRFESSLKCSTSIGFTDPRTEEGELLWPQYKDEAEVSQIEKDMGGKDSATVAAQLQQRPAPSKGLIFQKDWFQYYTKLPERLDFVVDSWDLTFKDTDGSDFVAGQRWGVLGSKYFLFPFRVKKRLSFVASLAEIKTFGLAELVSTGESGSMKPPPKAMAILIEDKANGPAVISALEKEISGIVAVNPEGGKVARANAATPLYEAKNVYHPDPSIAPWIEDHEASLLKFPKGKNDDDVDSETQALNYLRNKTGAFNAAMDRLKEEGTQWFTS